MQYYYLRVGDYIQLGDEVYSKSDDEWLPISYDWFGRKYGYNDAGEKHKWITCRRLAPDGLVINKKNVIVPMQK